MSEAEFRKIQIRRHKHSNGRLISKSISRIIDRDLIALQEAAYQARLELEYQSQGCRELVKNGIWQVPVWERPKGWEKFGAREPETTTSTTMDN